MNKLFICFASGAGAVAVAAGAMLAHQLKSKMPAAAMEVYETAVRYQFYHVFALLAAGLLAGQLTGPWINRAGLCFMAGILLFSGSLYIISGLMSSGSPVPKMLGICTPLGGLGFILGWIFLGLAVWNSNRS